MVQGAGFSQGVVFTDSLHLCSLSLSPVGLMSRAALSWMGPLWVYYCRVASPCCLHVVPCCRAPQSWLSSAETGAFPPLWCVGSLFGVCPPLHGHSQHNRQEGISLEGMALLSGAGSEVTPYQPPAVFLPLLLELLVKALEGTGQSRCSCVYHACSPFPIPKGPEAIISIKSLFVHFLTH